MKPILAIANLLSISSQCEGYTARRTPFRCHTWPLSRRRCQPKHDQPGYNQPKNHHPKKQPASYRLECAIWKGPARCQAQVFAEWRLRHCAVAQERQEQALDHSHWWAAAPKAKRPIARAISGTRRFQPGDQGDTGVD
jgi:hypothetical protein